MLLNIIFIFNNIYLKIILLDKKKYFFKILIVMNMRDKLNSIFGEYVSQVEEDLNYDEESLKMAAKLNQAKYYNDIIIDFGMNKVNEFLNIVECCAGLGIDTYIFAKNNSIKNVYTHEPNKNNHYYVTNNLNMFLKNNKTSHNKIQLLNQKFLGYPSYLKNSIMFMDPPWYFDNKFIKTNITLSGLSLGDWLIIGKDSIFTCFKLHRKYKFSKYTKDIIKKYFTHMYVIDYDIIKYTNKIKQYIYQNKNIILYSNFNKVERIISKEKEKTNINNIINDIENIIKNDNFKYLFQSKYKYMKNYKNYKLKKNKNIDDIITKFDINFNNLYNEVINNKTYNLLNKYIKNIELIIDEKSIRTEKRNYIELLRDMLTDIKYNEILSKNNIRKNNIGSLISVKYHIFIKNKKIPNEKYYNIWNELFDIFIYEFLENNFEINVDKIYEYIKSTSYSTIITSFKNKSFDYIENNEITSKIGKSFIESIYYEYLYQSNFPIKKYIIDDFSSNINKYISKICKIFQIDRFILSNIDVKENRLLSDTFSSFTFIFSKIIGQFYFENGKPEYGKVFIDEIISYKIYQQQLNINYEILSFSNQKQFIRRVFQRDILKGKTSKFKPDDFEAANCTVSNIINITSIPFKTLISVSYEKTMDIYKKVIKPILNILNIVYKLDERNINVEFYSIIDILSEIVKEEENYKDKLIDFFKIYNTEFNIIKDIHYIYVFNDSKNLKYKHSIKKYEHSKKDLILHVINKSEYEPFTDKDGKINIKSKSSHIFNYKLYPNIQFIDIQKSLSEYQNSDIKDYLYFNQLNNTTEYIRALALYKLKFRAHGQRKLYVTHVDFLNRVYEKTDLNQKYFMIYMGSAPGNSLLYLTKLYPNLKILCFDPSPHEIIDPGTNYVHNSVDKLSKKVIYLKINKVLKDKYYMIITMDGQIGTLPNNYTPGISYIGSEFEDIFNKIQFIMNEHSSFQIFIYEDIVSSHNISEIAINPKNDKDIYFKEDLYKFLNANDMKLLFVSDIRSSNEDGSITDYNIWKDMLIQEYIMHYLEPEFSYLKFRSLYMISTNNFNKILENKDIYENIYLKHKGIYTLEFISTNNYTYIKGDIILQPWIYSTENRLFVEKKNLNEIFNINGTNYDNKSSFLYIFMKNFIYFKPQNNSILKLIKDKIIDGNYDWALETNIWLNYYNINKLDEDFYNYITQKIEEAYLYHNEMSKKKKNKNKKIVKWVLDENYYKTGYYNKNLKFFY